MTGFDDKKVEESLRSLRNEAQESRRRAEQIGGAAIVGTSVLVAVAFLWILALSLKRPFDLVLTLTVVGGAVMMFAWGLKIAIFGR